MHLPFRNRINLIVTTFLLIWLNTISVEARKRITSYLCPTGFNLSYIKYSEEPICYLLKGPESFEDRFVNCAGNLYTSELYNSLNFTKPNLVLWAEYKSLYPGGPFIDWTYNSNMGDMLTTTYDVKYDPALGIDEEFCVVTDPVTNFTATRCGEKHYRYCFVKPYPDEGDMTNEGCEELTDYIRFWSPRATCLAPIIGAGSGTVRATWSQAQELCKKRKGSLLHRGWRYANNPILHVSGTNWTDPLGIVMTPGDTLIWFDEEDGNDMVPDTEWNFRHESFSPETSMGALNEGAWHLVNNSYMFFNIICERSIHLRNVSLNLSVDLIGRLTLSVNDTVDENQIYCYTDSVIYYPTKVKLARVEDSNVFVLKPILDGQYWCVHVDSRNFSVTTSNRVLFVRDKQSVENLYAVKIRVKRKYRFENLEKLYQVWTKKLKQYIYYRTKYVMAFGELETVNPYRAEGLLKEFVSRMPGLDLKEQDVIRLTKLKRLYLDGRTALLHVQLNPEMLPASPGVWEDLEVMYMKPAYYCRAFDSVPMLALGQSITSHACRAYTCVGNFDEGVQWVATVTDGCTTTLRAPVNVDSTINFKKEVTLFTPTAISGDSITSTRNQQFHIKDSSSDSSEEIKLNTTTEETITTPCDEEVPSTTTEVITETMTPSFTSTSVLITTTSVSETVSTVTMPPQIVTTVNTPPEIVTTVSPPTRPPIPPNTTTTTTTPRPPEDQLQQVLEDLESIVNNDTVPILVEDVNESLDQVNTFLEKEKDLEIPGELLHLLDRLGSRIDLNGSSMGISVWSNIALLMADAGPELPIRGLKIAARDDSAFTDNAFEIITEEINSTHLTSDVSEAVVHLPQSVASSSRRISFVVFRNDRAFDSGHINHYFVNSRVLSVNIENLTQFDDGEVIDIHLHPISENVDRNRSRACAYWHFFDDGTGYWSQEGCTFIRARQEGMLDTCRCDHLTHFAEVLIPRAVFSQRNEDILELISIIGCCLSIFGIIMVGLTAILFRSWRRDFSNKIWLQLCVSIFLLSIIFLVIVFAKFDEYDIPCMLIGVALHYFVLASFCWMLVAAVLSYRRLVLVFTRDASHKLLRASAFSWGVPCAVVGILLSASPHSYGGRFEEKTPSGAFCYPSGLALWLSVYAPIAIMLLANWTLFVLIVRSVFASRRIQRHGDANEALRCASVSCLLVFLFGLPWIFGLFAFNVVAAYFFTLTATFQGFVLFIFFVLGNKKTRDLWLNKLKIKQTRKIPVTSSTYTNKSSGVNWRGASGGAASMEASTSKPRSLSSPDDSRFS